MAKQLNRIKVILAEKNLTNKWLSEQLGKDPATVSKWVINSSQPPLETLLQIAGCLNVPVSELLNYKIPQIDVIFERRDEKNRLGV